MAESKNVYDLAIAELNSIVADGEISEDQLVLLSNAVEDIRFDEICSFDGIDLLNYFSQVNRQNLPWQPQGVAILDFTKGLRFNKRNLLSSDEQMQILSLFHPIYASLIQDIFLVLKDKSVIQQALLFKDFSAHAFRLDLGGILRENDAERDSHMNYLEQFLFKEKCFN